MGIPYMKISSSLSCAVRAIGRPILFILLCGSFIPRLSAQSTARFAVIGDYGFAGQPEADVAAMVKKWNPEFIITTGDNNYEFGADSSIDRNIGQYYHSFIFPYSGLYGEGDTVNRFFPSLGNHDWRDSGAGAYLKYFSLPGNERYYDIVRGPVHLFAIDSDDREPDGNTDSSAQALWLKKKLLESTSLWKVVYFHHAPFSSGDHGDSPKLNWPFKEWGASVVISGHDHTYERVVIGDFTYIVNGLGGRSIYEMKKTTNGSKIRYNDDYGALDVAVDPFKMVFRFVARKDSLIDNFTITAPKK